MNEFKALESFGKLKQIVLLGSVFAVASLVFGQADLAKGIIFGGTTSVFNYYITSRTVIASHDKTPREAQNIFMRSAFARMIISFVVLFITFPFGVPFFLGVTLGLILQMLSYMLEAMKMIVKGVKY